MGDLPREFESDEETTPPAPAEEDALKKNAGRGRGRGASRGGRGRGKAGKATTKGKRVQHDFAW
jgi:hypothetical protein